jgi:phosphatidylserine/phosphatidylglycerophosphate/cardiolipin synthase-like enzyme
VGTWYTLYFTKPSYPEQVANRQGGVDEALVADFDRARQTIDAAVFDVRLPSLVNALVSAARRGVKVRMVVDYAANQDAADFRSAIDALEQGGVQITRDHRSALMHNKFVVIDGRVLWTGSMNFTPNDVYRNNNNMLRLELPALIVNYKQRFERLFQKGAAGAPSRDVPNPRIPLDNGVVIENYFSPNGGAQTAILNRLKSATKSIQVTAFTFTDTPMGKVLQARSKANVLVQGVFESRNNNMRGAEYDVLKRAGLDILADGNCYTLHSKLMIIDDRTVVMGSYNFTENANKSNDENLLILDDPALAQNYVDEFNRIYAQAQHPTVCGGSDSRESLTADPEQ